MMPGRQGYFYSPPDGGKSHPVNFQHPPSPEIQNTPPTGVHSPENQKPKCEKFFACGELSSIMLFNFVHDFINYMCAIVTKAVKMSPAASFRRSCSSISFTISLIICVRL